MRVDRLVPSLIVLLLLGAAAVHAQSLQVGTITGTVADASGAVAPGVTVTLTSPVLLTPRTIVTDSAGGYAFQSLPLGDYTASYELSGFKKVLREGLTVTAARTLTVDVTLEAGNLAETVTVVGGPPTVDVTNTNVATSIDTQALQTIPTARDVWAILQNLAPQVVLDREDVGGSQGGLQAVFSAFGSTWHQNTYALNGVNVTDPAASGAAGFYYDFDSFQETQVSTAQHSAEIGTPGVYYNIIVKSGTDSFHGGSAYYFENSSMVSDNLSQELRDQGVSIGSSINLFSDWTAQLGGPLARQRLRFFTSWRDWRIHRDVVDFPESENTDMFSGLGNVTYQLNPQEPHHRTVHAADVLQAQSKRERAESSRDDVDRRRYLHDLPGRLQLADQQQRGVRCAGELLDHHVPAEPAAGHHGAERGGAFDRREQRRGVAEFRSVAHTACDRRRDYDLQANGSDSTTTSRPATSTSAASPTPFRMCSRAST